jgi:hypothetical protein
MPRRKTRHVEKPWQPDPSRWKGFMEKGKGVVKRDTLQPKGGWQLWDWKTFKDVPQ